MKGLITLLILVTGFAGPVASEPAYNSTFDSIGLMPEIVVTAPRYEYENEAWSGLMPEVVVTAPRYDGAEVSSVGMASEVEPNTLGTDNEPSQTSMHNRESNQPFSIDINIIIILSVLGTMSLIIGLFLLPHFMRKYSKPAKQLCNCEK